MKNIQTFEGFSSSIKNKFFPKKEDEETANNLLTYIKSDTIITADNGWAVPRKYLFVIDEFPIEIGWNYGGGIAWDVGMVPSKEYTLSVDSLKLNCSNKIKRKIFEYVKNIYKEKENEEELLLKKDIKVHFRTKDS